MKSIYRTRRMPTGVKNLDAIAVGKTYRSNEALALELGAAGLVRR